MKIKTSYSSSLCIMLVFAITSCKAQKNDIIKKDAKLTLLAEDYEFTEGPAVDKNGNVFFTDQPNNRILKWEANSNQISTYLEPSGRANGLYFDNDGNLIACADNKNELWLIDANKKTTVLFDDFKGKKLNGPNDLWIDKKGGMYMTDPYYKRPYWTREQDTIPQRVYYISPAKDKLEIIADHYVQPNGIIGTPDNKTLYVADIGANKTYSYTINDDATLTDKKVFCNLGSDGMTIDNQGNVYLTGDGVTIFNSEGKQIEHIATGEDWTANVTFGGPKQNLLFITAMDAIYAIEMNVHGVR